jgi:hypothetical protein
MLFKFQPWRDRGLWKKCICHCRRNAYFDIYPSVTVSVKCYIARFSPFRMNFILALPGELNQYLLWLI